MLIVDKNDCIACKACVDVAESIFTMNEDNSYAFVVKQPLAELELELADEAIQTCPVDAIKYIDVESELTLETEKYSSNDEKEKSKEKQISQLIDVEIDTTDIITAKSNIKETLDKYPQLKDVLVSLSPKFKKMQNPILYNTLARFATFTEAANVTGLSVCEILHTLNKAIGKEKKLVEFFPDCISQDGNLDEKLLGSEITWNENNDRFIYNSDTMPEIIERVNNLKPQESIIIISVNNPIELLKVAEGLNYQFNVEKGKDYRISIFNPNSVNLEMNENWERISSTFPVLDVRYLTTDPFDTIIKTAYGTEEGSGFILIQRFVPFPIINMLTEMGFDHKVQRVTDSENYVFFYKKITEKGEVSNSNKKDVIIQSATPVAYPVIMRLLQSDKIRSTFNIKELKVWEETEKHLAWITSGKADISFSALIVAAKLKNSNIKIPALFVWDNFYLLTRYKATSFADILGKKINTPLFEEAPPTKITKYLMKSLGYNSDDFTFVYGKPFGRPEQIYADFVRGTSDTCILREPEASFAIKILEEMGEEISIISFNELWNQVNQNYGSFPNAGVVIKEEFYNANKEESMLFLNELKEAINWVNQNKHESAKLSFDMMRQPVERVELFLNRVKYEYVDGEKLIDNIKSYFNVLNSENITEVVVDDKFLNMFKL